MNSNLPPFLTPYELIRIFTNAFSLTKQSKVLDDRAHNLTADYRDIKPAIEEFIRKPLENYLDNERATLIGTCFSMVFADYLQLFPNVDLDGINRTANEGLLAKYFLPSMLVRVTDVLIIKMPGPDPITLLGTDTSAVATVLTWAENNLHGWAGYLVGLSGDDNKDKRDRINAWKRGVDLPTIAYIKGLQQWSNGPWPEFIDWNHLKAWLLIGRAIDWAKKNENGQIIVDEIRALLWGALPTKTYQTAAEEAQIHAAQKHQSVFQLVANLQHELMRTVSKLDLSADDLKYDLDKLRSKLVKIDGEATTTHWVDWHEARWHVFSGDLKTANQVYKRAFEGCLYRSGNIQKDIMAEARAVAASQKNPDKSFLKKIKNISILFGLESPPSVCFSNENRNKASDFIELWEIELWKDDFTKLFPQSGYFIDVKISTDESRIGPLIFSNEESIKPDYRYPNRKIKIGETWKKSFPQLVWFSMNENIPIVLKLLEKGATLDCESDAGDTPILIALECLNAFDFPLKSLDRTIWDLFCDRPDAKARINSRTQKRKLLPLILAVKSGLPDIVRKVLELGADANGRGETDEQTALYVCIKLIGAVKSPDKFWKTQLELGLTPEVMESIRRFSNGMVRGSHAQQHYAELSESNFYQKVKGFMFSSMKTRMMQHYNIGNLYEIAGMLIDADSDANAEHLSPVRGYTPLMLAAELNEADLFSQLLSVGGRPDKTYFVERDNRNAECWDIAMHFASFEVINVLNDIRSHFNKPEIKWTVTS